MSQHNPHDDWLMDILKTFALWFWLIAVGAWYLSMALTKMLLAYVVNPLLGGALDKENGDAWVVIISSIIWETVALLLFIQVIVPELRGASLDEFRQALLVMVGAGLAWGVSIGFWIVLTWWSGQHQESSLHFTEVSGLPAEFYQPASPLPVHHNQQELSLPELQHRMSRVREAHQ